MKLFARLLVSDFPTELAFWRDVIGLSTRYADERMQYAMFDVGGDSAGLEVFGREAFMQALGQTAPVAGSLAFGNLVVVQVDDVDAVYGRAVEHGATAVAAPKDRPEWQARTAHVTDPEGHLVELYSALGAPQG